MAKKAKKERITKAIWAKIRYYQMIDEMPDAVLAEYLGICTRTLLNYDKCSASLTLGQVAAFIEYTDRKVSDIFSDDDIA